MTRHTGRVEQVEEPAVDLVGQPPAVRRADRALLGDQHLVGLRQALLDRVPVDARPVEPAQVDHLGVDLAVLLDRRQHVRRHPEVGEDGDVGARAAHRGPADGEAVVPVVDRPGPRRAVEVDVLQHDDRVVDAERGVHQPHVVVRRAGRDDPPARRGGEDAGRVHRVLRPVTGAHRDLAAQHQRHAAGAAVHVPRLGDLVEQLVRRDPHEVGVHELHDRA